jgi:hypothetical protein
MIAGTGMDPATYTESAATRGDLVSILRSFTKVREEKLAPAVSQRPRSQQVGCKERGLATPGPTSLGLTSGQRRDTTRAKDNERPAGVISIRVGMTTHSD